MPANVIPLQSVKSELNVSLSTVARDIELYFTAPRANTQALASAMAEVQRMQGVLQVLSLQGASVFCAEIKAVLENLTSLDEVPNATRDALRHALHGLRQYLEAVASGAFNSALCLFSEYQALHQARGLETAFELDLFFPNLTVNLPQQLFEHTVTGDVANHLKVARMQYQQALLKWLKKDDTTEALQAMQAAIRSTLAGVPANMSRAFWWVASGFIDCLIHDAVTPELDVKKLLGQIDRQMKLLLDDNAGSTDAVMHELLYQLACSEPVTETVTQIKKVYGLSRYLSKETFVLPSVTAAALGQMTALLNVADQDWEMCATGNAPACAKFYEQFQQLSRLAEQLDADTLQPLCQQIRSVAGHKIEPLNMALALLLLRGGIKHYQELGESFHEQVRLVNACLQAGIENQPADEASLARITRLYFEMKQESVAAFVATEMRHNTQRIEQGLTRYFADTTQQQELSATARDVGEVHGTLYMLGLVMSAQVAQKLHQMIHRYLAEESPTPPEMRWIAAAVSALDVYLQGLEQLQRPATDVLAELLAQAKSWARDESLAEPEEESVAGVSVRAGGEDEELLEVFLEEATEVLETLRNHLKRCRADVQDRDALTTIRRGFHTLKGSSRMVGLKEFGEVAWAVERAMNRWLQDVKPANAAVLDMAGDAEVVFQHWVDVLRSGSATAKIDASALLSAAQRIEMAQEDVAEVPELLIPIAAVVPPEETQQVKAQEGNIVIGSVSLSPTLFKIATEEAAGHVQALLKHWAELQTQHPPIVSYDFMRAAHTLAGVNRTLGFTQIADLAYALELWLDGRIGKTFALEPAQLVLLEQAVTSLDEMCATVRDRKEPTSQAALITALNATTEIAPPAEKPVNPVAQPAVKPVVKTPSEATSGGVRDEVDEQLLPIFLEEANELYPRISESLSAWRDSAGADPQIRHALQRSLHTLKGSARMAGAMRVGEMTHQVEGRIETAISKNKFDDALWQELETLLQRIGGEIDGLAGVGTTMEGEANILSTATTQAEQQTLEVGAERAIQAALLRVRSDTVDRLVNEAGEVSVARSRIELELREFKSGILELTDSVHRLRQQLREIEIQAEGQIQARTTNTGDTTAKFDPLEFDRFTRFQELTRFMNESVHDVQTIQQSLLKNISETEAALTAQGQINRELQQGLMAIRMVAFSSVGDRLYRVVRQTAKELGKRVNLELRGQDVELDRSVLEKMTAPFEHLLRNAIVHGLESPAERERSNKTPIGEIRLSLRQESNEVVFELSDDGAGLDMPRLRQKAIEQGLLQSSEDISEELAVQMIFRPGLSTAKEVTEIAGRGVGLDVVRSEVSALGGRLDVISTTGKGLRFIIHLPLTLAVTRTLMVRAGKELYALPATMVEQVQQVKPQALEEIYLAGKIEWQGKVYPLHYLARLLNGENIEPTSTPYNALLLLHSGESRIALHVDELIGNQEVVVKNIGPQLARLPGIAGATVTGSGAVVLIINPIVFVQQNAAVRRSEKVVAPIEPVHRVPLIMVVDDSLTVRKITTRLLLRAGYQVATAKDGEDALEQLADLSPAVMLLDVEMPRMDGFELAKRLRQDAKTEQLPIIMITSRTADKHRDYAMEIGVNEYMGKPYQEDALLESLALYAPLSK